ncbi:hypothetical protein CTER_2876 [Ruminiclostridium cellobioparum subsp. termitidis CT1112]|uniref:Uncharacterized protein n=1 Tax=Ruminiclostridium cellobioparum subsp. termitidis CT1112 TaxID=1195236 RepID=S0FHL2_RUMCE|nr:hypothetical protein CTER_2876 [Ruminiclostridium cellobioparum subsp. termitidis CT1112]
MFKSYLIILTIFNTDDITMVLLADSMNDISECQKAVISNCIAKYRKDS